MARLASILVIALFVLSLASTAHAGEVLGKITAFKANLVTIALKEKDKDKGPDAKTECELYKRFETKLGMLKASGWLDIAKAVVEVAGSVLKVKIIEQKSKMKVNGKPVNHFKPGTEVKLTWK